MHTDNDGGPAFPAYKWSDPHGQMMAQGGMSLRDYFAAKAMQGSLPTLKLASGDEMKTAAQVISNFAYIIADAMLAAREVKP